MWRAEDILTIHCLLIHSPVLCIMLQQLSCSVVGIPSASQKYTCRGIDRRSMSFLVLDTWLEISQLIRGSKSGGEVHNSWCLLPSAVHKASRHFLRQWIASIGRGTNEHINVMYRRKLRRGVIVQSQAISCSQLWQQHIQDLLLFLNIRRFQPSSFRIYIPVRPKTHDISCMFRRSSRDSGDEHILLATVQWRVLPTWTNTCRLFRNSMRETGETPESFDRHRNGCFGIWPWRFSEHYWGTTTKRLQSLNCTTWENTPQNVGSFQINTSLW